MKKLITAVILATTAITAQALSYEPTSPHPEIELRKLPAGECKELMYASAKPTDADRAKGQLISSAVDAFGHYGWRLNSKGQYVRFTCSKYANYALIAPKSVIDTELAREKQANVDKQKAKDLRIKNSGLL
jgi:hypothetical protein